MLINIKAKKNKLRVYILSAVLVLLIIGILVMYSRPFNLDSHGHRAIFAPITVFGLSPFDADSTELLSENIVFTKDLSQTGMISGFYNVEMNYNVKVHDKARFVLPFAHMTSDYNAKSVQIYIDGTLVQYSSGPHLNAYVSRPMRTGQQSVDIGPNHIGQEQRPDDSYEILIDTWRNNSSNIKWNPDWDDFKQDVDGVDMYEFDIGEPGEYHITVKLVAIGESRACDNYMAEWAGSPNKMWSGTGDRKIRIDIGDNQYNYDLSDKLFRFELEK